MKHFGTDGIRGKIGEGSINPQFFLQLGWAIGRVFRHEDRHARVLIGKDTRISGYMFESVLQAGLAAAGADIILLGPMPTPAIAYLTRTFNVDVGVVISASHNSYRDNGIKFFSSAGTKLDDALEEKIERQLEKQMTLVEPLDLGRAARIMDARGRYIEFCKSTVGRNVDLSDYSVVLDCANGATYSIAQKVFSELRMKTEVIHNEPDGININNNCGSTHPQDLCKKTKQCDADVGIAFDGDGDRMLMCDADGNVVDGDVILYILAKYMQDTGQLQGEVVGTEISNCGLEQSLKKLGIGFRRVKVGDRHIIAELLENNAGNLGGENSGHIVCAQYTTTGDGIIAALQVLAALKHFGVSLPDMVKEANLVPVETKNLKVENPKEAASSKGMRNTIEQIREKFNGEGLVVVRPSGTEPVLRLLVGIQDRKLRSEAIETLTQAANGKIAS